MNVLDLSEMCVKFPNKIPSGINILYCERKKISNLPDNLDSIIELFCGFNLIKEIRLDNWNLLTHLGCNNNQLTELCNFPKSLVYLNCEGNNIIELNKLPAGLKYLKCGFNKIEKMEISDLIELTYFDCEKNKIKEIEFPPNLITLNCNENPFNNLNVKHLKKLKYFSGEANDIPPYTFIINF